MIAAQLPRIPVLLQDMARAQPVYLSSWHVFLPSDVNLVCWNLFVGFGGGPTGQIEIWWVRFVAYQSDLLKNLRISSVYHYSFDLFKEKLVGPDGVPCSSFRTHMCAVVSASRLFNAIQVRLSVSFGIPTKGQSGINAIQCSMTLLLGLYIVSC